MAEREFRTTPQWPIATTPLSGDELVEVWKGGKQYYVPFSELGGMPAAHSGTHKHGGDDEVGTLDNLAYEIPKLDADGLIDSRVSDASTTTKGIVQLATDGEEDATKAVNGTDSRLKNARPPTAHASQHIAGTDVIADATVSNSGLMSAADKVKADATIPANIPTADQKAALVGSYGTPSATNKYVTESDPVLSSGGGGGTTGPDLIGIGQKGSGLSIGVGVGDPALAGLNSTDVAFIDRFNVELRCYTFSGTNWTQKGNGLSIVGVNVPALASLNSTDVAFIDRFIGELRCYTFNGTNWTQKGNGLSIVGVNVPALGGLNSTDVAFIDSNGKELRCYTFNGTNWTQKGNGLSIAITGGSALAGLNSTDIAFIDSGKDELRCYTFDGTNWTQKGSGLTIANVGELALAPLSSTDVAFIDRGNDELRCYTFDGTNWTQKGSGLSIANTGELALASLSSTDVAFIDGNGKELRTYNFLFGYDSASVNIAADYEVPEIATGKSIVIRRTSAYDGNPVTITPPSGATFEGLASLSLYGQYSFVELERISSTVFVIKDSVIYNTSNRSLNGGVTKVVEIYKQPKIRQISGVIRYYDDVDGSGNPGWNFINNHYALGLGLQVSATSSTVNLTWTISDFVNPKVVSFVCTPDEGYAKMGLFCGASVAFNSAAISLYAGELGDYIKYNSDTGLWESSYGNITAAWSGSLLHVSISAVEMGGAKLIHRNYPFPTIGNRCGAVGSVQVEGQTPRDGMHIHELSFWNHAGTQITSPQAGMRFWIKTGIPKPLNPLTDFSEGNSNIWFNGYIIDADSVGG